ncbi:hypothetical protein JYU34_009868 [Plutella xylostella]|uniref:Integrase catalytic domain-containing protein n=1 Tax=Plutella xylostella TaxID=51655 RepID=A0ABQ7QKJ8_PLUXY|nr:hypothetical protein JYU34_009868 [Plutella xylostella]
MSKKLDSSSYRQWEEHRNNLDSSPTLQQFIKFLINRADLLETLTDTFKYKQNNKPNNNNDAFKTKNFLVSTDNTRAYSCPMCSQSHGLFNCPSFKALDIDSRIKKAKESRVCMNCLRLGHVENACTLTHCKYCKYRHNTLLHKDVNKNTYTNKSASVPTTSGLANNVALSSDISPSTLNNHGSVLLSTALVKVADKHGSLHTARLLLDNGSTSNFVTESLCEKLDLKRYNASSTVSGINNHATSTTESCDLAIQSYTGDYRTNVRCHVLPHITKCLPSSYIDTTNIPIPTGILLADPSFNEPAAIDILVGAEFFWDVLGTKTIDLGKRQPKLHHSKLGWLLSGCVYNNNIPHSQSYLCHFTDTSRTEPSLTRFWELDSVSSKHCLSFEENKCEEHFKNNTCRDVDGRFIVTMPLKESPEVLGNSYTIAKRRLLSLERKLDKDHNLKHRYHEFMREYLDLGHMTENNNTYVPNETNYFLPHHGVIRESSSSTKLRVVFEANVPSSSGKSLNDIQRVGPTVQDDLFSIILRFRQHKFVVTADIEKMYRAIWLNPVQRPLQQILFRFDANEPIKSYTLNTATYGTASAPYLATKCLVSLAETTSDARVQEAIRHDFFVDDYLGGGDSVESVVEVSKGIIETLKSAQFNLRKWQSNNFEILKQISELQGDPNVTLNLDNSPSKTLGVYWNSSSDNLYFEINIKAGNKITKRTILSLISQVFDPLGLVGPCTVETKILIQKLWINKYEWDQEVPQHIKTLFHEIINSLHNLNQFNIPRWAFSDNIIKTEIHTFSDASERAYGSCVYIRTIRNDGTAHVCLLTSKNKVAPIKPTTIPRLELCGALLGTRLCKKVLDSLTVKIDQCYYWSDSTIVLGWLNTATSRLERFVRNRVNEIQESTAGDTWSYVPSKQNPADLVSRGVKADLISASALWWSGPTFLHNSNSEFPSTPNLKNINQLPDIVLHTSIVETNEINTLMNKISNYSKLIRIFAYVQRFIYNCKNSNKKYGNLSFSELKSSKIALLQIAQQEMFTDEYHILKSGNTLNKKNRLISLSPFYDTDNNLIRVGGRLDNSCYSYNVKHPILLCSKHPLTKLIFEFHHITLLHAGPLLMLSCIRQNYWPLSGRNLAKRIVRTCVRCFRVKPKTIQPVMGNLPSHRTKLEFPFLNTGVDYAGPVLIADRSGRGARLTKSYLCIFICLAVKAVHIELVSSLTKEAYLAALNRFMARRGRPQTIYSDHGSNFIGGFNELSDLFRNSLSDIPTILSHDEIDFKFIPPYSPHFGGIWEAAVKSVKHHLRRVLALAHLTYEEMITCLNQIEAILNSRPLTPLSSDPSDLSFLSPSHFLIGRPLTSVPYPQVSDCNVHRLDRFQRIEFLRQHFWKRYCAEYVTLLQQKTKWLTSTGHLQVGSLVLVKDKTQPPLMWLMGRIVQLHPGKDGVSRVADIETKRGIIQRAYNNICPLPLDC